MTKTIEQLAQDLMQNPFDHTLRVQYAHALVQVDRLDEALKQADLILSQMPQNGPALLLKTECLFELNQKDEAQAVYREWRRHHGASEKTEWDDIFEADNLIVLGGKKTETTEPEEKGRAPISFKDVVGMTELKEELRMKIIMPFTQPEMFAKYKKAAGGGMILYGPPGCGKTMIARAIATECNAEFIDVRLSDILSKWLGEAESRLASYFKRAREKRPAVLFFDELDGLAISRSRIQSEHMRTLIDEFLMQLDGFGADNEKILLLAATNMPWDIDNAMKRTGRFSRQLFLPPPDADARAEMFRVKLEGIPCEKIAFAKLASLCEHYSGADLDGVVDLAKEKALGAYIKSGVEVPVKEVDLAEAIKKTVPAAREWLGTVRNLVKYGGGDNAYADVEAYLKKHKLL